MKILITAGPTREPIDAVRFIGNASSGKMGLALAKESVNRGYDVTVVLGPVEISTPKGAKVIRITTANEMLNETLRELKNGYDVLISVAAIADYTFVKTVDRKLKSGKRLMLELKPTRKLTREVGGRFPRLFVAAFKAEYGVSAEKLISIAKEKLHGEKLDLIVANDIKKHKFGDDDTEVYIIDRNDRITNFKGSKQEAAIKILDSIKSCVSSH